MWGKIIGGMAGFAMGGPLGSVVGAALGHAAETGTLGPQSWSQSPFGMPRLTAPRPRDEVFAFSVIVLAAKLAKCDGPVSRREIEAFKRNFRIPPESARDVGRLFDHARDSAEDFRPYAEQLRKACTDNPAMLENVLGSLFAIARADGAVNATEERFLQAVSRSFGLADDAWSRAREGRPNPVVNSSDEDPYRVIGVTQSTSDEEIRATWLRLMRENHPDSLASRGVAAQDIASRSDRVARINAAWDRIKRDRGL